MKSNIMEVVLVLFVSFCLTATTGCGDAKSGGNQERTSNVAGQLKSLKELELAAGIVLPTNAVLVNCGDGGGRDAGYGFYTWTVFSPVRIDMPVMQAVGVKDYLRMPLADTVKFLEGRLRTGKVAQPELAYSSEWTTNGHDYQGTIVRTPQGDYFVVDRFIHK